MQELGEVDLKIRGEVAKPAFSRQSLVVSNNKNSQQINYKLGEEVATRKAYGNALKRLGGAYQNLVSLDGDVKNSTYAEIFKEAYPDRFYEMYIAEQNMVGTAVGLARLGFIPFASSFACFLTRAFDQIRMASIGGANIKLCGSHAGVSIGEDGPSQMGLEDIAMFRSVAGSVVLYPADAVSAEKLVEEMIKTKGICYIRTSRPTTPVIYGNDEKFPIGGCKVHRIKPDVIARSEATWQSRANARMQITADWRDPAEAGQVERSLDLLRDDKRKVIIIAAGITLFEALKTQEELVKEGIEAIVVDCYSVKPIDEITLTTLARATLAKGEGTVRIITVEDHYFEGGLGDAVLNVFADNPRVKIKKLAVTKMPRSGKAAELMAYEGIDAKTIILAAKQISV